MVCRFFGAKGPFDNNAASVQITVWRWTGDIALIKPIIPPFTDYELSYRHRRIKEYRQILL